ncbi:S-adenosyl-L-methionine-dependent methyltransferase [Lactarius quietus]|nr:S-adenosyl-L-methionine-dependent methyltransferase [Lactarius quietus]
MNFYFDAARIIDRLDAKQGSVKSLLGTLTEKNRKRTAALVIETLKYKSALAEVIAAANLLKTEKKITSHNLALVLVHDLLLSGGVQAGDGPEFQRVKIKRGAKSDSELALGDDIRAARIPRYVRINSLKWSIDDAIKSFKEGGYSFGNPQDEMKFARDAHVENLLLFPPLTQLTDTPEYSDGRLILQDKASCFPAVVLAPPACPGSVIIDATAAPGNKTSHLSALMGNQGKILAFERDRKRYGTLKSMLARAGCSNVETLNGDFLSTDFKDNKYSREGTSEVAHTERLAKLAAFQLQMLRHAMKYPAVEKIVYSTCSIYPEENEQVVLAALQSTEAIAGGFNLASRAEVLPAWPRRGQPGILNDADTGAILRCSPGEDGTNGFFVSCFVRRSNAHLRETANAGRTHDPGAISRKRKLQTGDERDRTSPTLGGRRKKRKR